MDYPLFLQFKKSVSAEVLACTDLLHDLLFIQTTAGAGDKKAHFIVRQRRTLPSRLADTSLSLAVSSVGETAVCHTVWDITGLPFPVVFTLTKHRPSGVVHAALTPTRAVVGTCVHPERQKIKQKSGILERNVGTNPKWRTILIKHEVHFSLNEIHLF